MTGACSKGRLNNGVNQAIISTRVPVRSGYHMMKTILNAITGMLGLHPSLSEERIRELLANTYDNVEVVGRGTIYIDPQAVANCPEYKKCAEGLTK